MAEIIIQNLDLLTEEVVCTVEDSASDTELKPFHGICQRQTLDSLEHAIQAMKEYEQCTASNYVVVEKQKHFGDEAFRPTSSKVNVHWEGPLINKVCVNEYSGVPFVIVGRKVFGCHLGKDKAVSQKKKYAESTMPKESTDPASFSRRKTFQRTKKMDCPAKLYIYHVLKFPDFQIRKKTIWKMKTTSKKLRVALEKNIESYHSYTILFPELSNHNHPVEREVPRVRAKRRLRNVPKVKEEESETLIE